VVGQGGNRRKGGKGIVSEVIIGTGMILKVSYAFSFMSNI